MSEHLSGQMVENYCQRLLSAAELLAAHDHIDVCESCRLQLFKIEQVPAQASTGVAINNLADIIPEHPGFEDFAAYVDDRLDATDREILRSHIELCLGCAGELRDLLGFKAALANSPADPAVMETAASSKAKHRRWRLFLQWLQPQWARAFAVSIVFIGVVVWIALNRIHRTRLE